jgi:hypothetical protein
MKNEKIQKKKIQNPKIWKLSIFHFKSRPFAFILIFNFSQYK